LLIFSIVFKAGELTPLSILEIAWTEIPALHENFGHAKGLALALSVYGRDYLHEQAEVLRDFKFE
jgi:hypothetical protein